MLLESVKDQLLPLSKQYHTLLLLESAKISYCLLQSNTIPCCYWRQPRISYCLLQSTYHTLLLLETAKDQLLPPSKHIPYLVSIRDSQGSATASFKAIPYLVAIGDSQGSATAFFKAHTIPCCYWRQPRISYCLLQSIYHTLLLFESAKDQLLPPSKQYHTLLLLETAKDQLLPPSKHIPYLGAIRVCQGSATASFKAHTIPCCYWRQPRISYCLLQINTIPCCYWRLPGSATASFKAHTIPCCYWRQPRISYCLLQSTYHTLLPLETAKDQLLPPSKQYHTLLLLESAKDQLLPPSKHIPYLVAIGDSQGSATASFKAHTIPCCYWRQPRISYCLLQSNTIPCCY